MENKITKRQFYSLCASFFMGNSLALAGGISKGEKIGYITIFFSFALYIGLLGLYGFLFKKYKTSDLFYISQTVLGKTFNKILLFIILLYSLFTALISSLEFLFFIELSSDFSFKPIWIALLFSVSLIFILLCEKKALFRYSEIILPFVIFIVGVILVFGIEKINLSNLKIENFPSISYILSNTVLNFISPFSNILILYFFSSDIFKTKNIKKESLKAGFIALLVIFGIYLMNLLIIGKNLMSSLYFPALYTFSVINPSMFTERSETVFFITYMFFDILYVAVSYFCAIECIKRLFYKKNTLSQKRKKVFFMTFPVLSFIIMNLKIDINSFYSSFSVIPFIVSFITLGTPLILILISLFKKSSCSPPLNSNSHQQ